MRRLMWFAIGFAAACGAALVLPAGWALPGAGLALILLLGVSVPPREIRWIRILAWILAGCAAGMGWFAAFDAIRLKPARALDGQVMNAVITVTDYSWETSYGVGADGILELEEKTYQVRFYLDERKPLIPGDRVQGDFLFQYTVPDESSEAYTNSGKGIFLLAYPRGDMTVTHSDSRNLRIFASELRQQIREILHSVFPEDTVGFAKALLMGDRSDLDYETDSAFKISGIRHIIAVSGLHVSILYGILRALTLKRRFLTAILGIPALILFAAVAGFTPSVTRAGIMVGLMMVATLFDKEYDGATELSVASLVMLIINPMVITSVSFQLSVASVAGIFLFSERIENWMKLRFGQRKGKNPAAWLTRWFRGSVSVTLSAISLTTPLCAWYFGVVSLVGIVTNLLTLWVVSLIFWGIVIAVPLHLAWSGAAGILGSVCGIMIRYAVAVAKGLASLPIAAVYTGSIFMVLWLIFVYVLLGIFLVTKKKRPSVLIGCGIIGLCLALLCSWSEPLTDECRVTVLDVGQGQCVILQSEGRTFLVDCGGDYRENAADLAADTLLGQGIGRLDGLILTHFDDDHAGGAAYLLTRVDADGIYVPDTEDNGVTASLEAVTEGQILRIWDDCAIRYGNTRITIFGPIYSGSSNENSLCILFETENCAILITGDRSAFGERMLLREYDLPDVDLLIAGHHGSKSSTSEELLMTVRPETVVISVGENRYGHPSEEVLARLEEFGCVVYRTDQHGTIIYRR